MRADQFVRYVLSFYGPQGVYPMGARAETVRQAMAVVESRFGRFVYDSVDRERVRDVLIEVFGLVFPVEKESANV